MASVISPLIAFLAVMALIPIARTVALKYGVVDVPGGRKQHEEAVPPIGGIVIFTVLMATMTVLEIFSSFTFPPALFLSLAIIVAVGLIDDIYTVDARLKFLVHFLVAGILVIWGGAKIVVLGNLLGFGNIYLGWMSIPFSIACVVYIINAINMMDGLDGLAGGNAFLVFTWFSLAAFLGGHTEGLIETLTFMAALLGFLFYNARSPWRKHAKVFLGDAGSMGIGVMIAWYAITLSQAQGHVLYPISVAWILALPIIDAFGLLVARLKDGKPPFAADRRHFHHHFVNAGFGVGASVALILGWSALLGTIGFLGTLADVPAYILGWAWVALWVAHTVLTVHSEKFITLLAKLRRKPAL